MRPRLTFANVLSVLALFIALGGASYAAIKLPKNSVGAKQIKKNAVTGPKVAAHSLTGEDLNLSTLGTVPNATNAVHATTADSATTTNRANTADFAQEAQTVNGFEVGCFEGTTLIRGMCFDSALGGPVNGVQAASNACAAEGGFLPSPMTLYSIHGIINLGNGTPPNFAVADLYYEDGAENKMVVVSGTGDIEALPVGSETKYICAYMPVG